MQTSTTVVARLRDELAERRQRNHTRRELRRELASFTSPGDIDDLLAAIADHEGPAAEFMRTVLLRNRSRITFPHAS